ncbi:MAG TPA: TIGR03435 family protein [Candidatus Acidoferrales bacterium]|nr:TIGR03435 family protein [Candidatus Acidoferrales bacterium]
MRNLLTVILVMLFAQSASGQSSESAASTFEVADVHLATRGGAMSFGGGVSGDRFTLRNATIIDLIAAAYGVDGDKVVGGPAWLEMVRFDVIAKAPSNTSPDVMKKMLQDLLADRFKLVIHSDVQPMPAYLLTAGKGKAKLQESNGSSASGCAPQKQSSPSGALPYLSFSCRNITMEAFAQSLPQLARGYLSKAVVDSTGVKGAWDFDVQWMPVSSLPYAGHDGVTVFDALDEQLGLRLELKKSPMSVVVVDSVNRKPTENLPEVAKAFPPALPREFELAVIKPSLPDARIRIVTNRLDEIELGGVSLKWMVSFAWGMPLAETPKWMDTQKFELVAKSPGAGWTDAQPLETADLQRMLRTVLIDRFKLVVHTEERPQDTYALIADKPKLEKADPLVRIGCKDEPGPDGKDPRITNPILAKLVTCRNTTMDQFAQRLSSISGGSIQQPVVNATGLEGGWNFTLSFTPGYLAASLATRTSDSSASESAGSSSSTTDPTGALSIFEAVSKQLGLKLEPRKLPRPVLVIDHAEQKPTDN